MSGADSQFVVETLAREMTYVGLFCDSPDGIRESAFGGYAPVPIDMVEIDGMTVRIPPAQFSCTKANDDQPAGWCIMDSSGIIRWWQGYAMAPLRKRTVYQVNGAITFRLNNG